MSYILANMLSWDAQILLRLGMAALLGALIGAERQRHGRSAGLRTHLLVALGAALAMVVSLHFGTVYGNSTSSTIRVDPARVSYGIMTGIGFLGAGAIITYGAGIRGLTTAASLWCTAAMGLASGFGMFVPAIVVTGIVIFALLVLSKVDNLIRSRWYKTLTVALPAGGQDNAVRLRDAIVRRGGRVMNVNYHCDIQASSETFTIHVGMPAESHPIDLIDLPKDIPEITDLSLQ